MSLAWGQQALSGEMPTPRRGLQAPQKPPLVFLSSHMSLLILTGHDHLFQRNTSPALYTLLSSLHLSHFFCLHS